MIELNIQYSGGLRAAAVAFRALYEKVLGKEFVTQHPPIEISKSYFQCFMCVNQWRDLLAADDEIATHKPSNRVIYKLWPDFKVNLLMDRSIATVKADAAFRSYAATGAGITWAVIDSGIDGNHPHFGSKADPMGSVIHHPAVAELHYDFTQARAPGGAGAMDGLEEKLDPTTAEHQAFIDAGARKSALIDELGHGTHVAGIIAGQLPKNAVQLPIPNSSGIPAAPGPVDGEVGYAVFEQVFKADAEGDRELGKTPTRRDVRKREALHGVAPECLLVSLKVIGPSGQGRVSDVMRALVYIRDNLNDDPKLLRIHGVNLSIGYDFDAEMFACGQSPLCVEVDRLVRSGVVVVVAAGNTGYGKVSASQRNAMVGLSNTINDPGNAALAITVGSTHRDSPHTYGVSFFSSKGPTGDGRLKPDLVAPGERITSCASKSKSAKMKLDVSDGVAAYVDDSGTSMAAPHVSGAIAAFLSIRREFIQRPEEVKRLFLANATSLGRERYFEGYGLVDLMRSIQSV
jgi:subtilisin family serine protease